MTQQFTASEVRRTAAAIEDKQMLVSSMLRAYADRLEADERAVPVAWMHPELHKRHPYADECLSAEAIGGWLPLYAHSAPSDAERLAEALRNLVEASHYADAPDEHEAAEAALTAHSAQAHPHDLIKTGDPDAAPSICDANGEVVLAYCRKCRQGEGDLAEFCPAQPPAASAPNDSQRLEFIVKYNWIGAKTRCDYHIPDGDLAQTRWAIDAAMLAAQENPNG